MENNIHSADKPRKRGGIHQVSLDMLHGKLSDPVIVLVHKRPDSVSFINQLPAEVNPDMTAGSGDSNFHRANFDCLYHRENLRSILKERNTES